MKKGTVDKVAIWLLIIGGLNLGLMTLLDINVIGYLGATGVWIANVLIGLSALYVAYKKLAK